MFFSIHKDKVIKKSLEINKKDFEYFYTGIDYEWYIGGNLFYLIHPHENNTYLIKNDINNDNLNSIILSKGFDPKSIKKAVEGHFICVIKKKEEIIVFGDKFNRLNLFYTEDRKGVYFDTVMSKDLLQKCGTNINEKYLYAYLLMGYGHASSILYKKIKRLGYDDILLFNGKLSLKNVFTPVTIENYSSEKLSEFENLFTHSVKSRMGDRVNLVSNSGGWDSTLIIDTLYKLTDKRNIKTAIFKVILQDGRIFNVYEIERAKRISAHYDVEHFIFQVNLSDKNLIDKWIKYAKRCFANHIFQWPINHFGIVDFIKKINPSVNVIFNGECADSLQNYGFSQYASIHSGINDFDEYADKMKTYLYGPSFMKEVLNNSFKKNKIYNIFKRMNNHLEFHDSDNDYSKLMLSFIYSSSRLPFNLPGKMEIFHKKIIEQFIQTEFDKYFNKYFEMLNVENIYSIWSALYADFHFKGLSVPMSIRSIEEAGITAALPFFDIQLAAFLEQMPESWGRGLNFNPVKYPEKMMILNSKTYPLNIVNDKNTHSYLSENDTSINYVYEYYLNSSVADYFKDVLNNKNALSFLDVEGINYSYIKRIKSDFLNNKVKMKDISIISKICVLSSILNEI